MAKTAYVRARIEPEIKAEFDRLLDKLGLSMSDAIGLFFRWAVREKKLPADDLRRPNAEMQKAIQEIQSGKARRTFRSVNEMRRFYGD